MAELAAFSAESEAASRSAGAAVALLVVDDECRVAEANLAACRLLGRGRADIAERSLTELLTPAAAERLAGVWDAFHSTGGHAGPFELAWPATTEPIDINVTAAVLPGRHLVLVSPSRAAEHPVSPEANGDADPSPRQPTNREREILTLLAGGDTDSQIAGRLELSPATVQTHVRNAKAKLGARTRAQAVAMAIRRGLIVAD